MQFKNIVFERRDGVAVIKLNRPKEFNAFNYELFDDFIKALEFCADDHETKVVVIGAEGRAFSGGGDVLLFKSTPDAGDTLRQLIKLMNTTIITIRRMPKPVIAMINGITAGGGMSLAAACDLRVCAASAKFRQAYLGSGLVPDGGWTLLVPLLVGFGKAAELVFLDPVINAKEALDMGLVTKVVEDGDLEKATMEIALQLAKGPSISYALVKKNLNHAFFGLLESQLELERESMTYAGRTEDVKEGLAAFAEKRKPNFTGR
ncbi:MAG: enoyl-CoA hydratase-related protein [Pseudomonadota bacterium]